MWSRNELSSLAEVSLYSVRHLWDNVRSLRSFPCKSSAHAGGSCPEPLESTRHPIHPVCLRLILLSYHLCRVLLDGCLHSRFSTNKLVFCAHHICPFELHVLPISYSSTGSSFHLLKVNILKLLIGGLLRTLYSLSRPNAARPQISLPSNAKECYRAA